MSKNYIIDKLMTEFDKEIIDENSALSKIKKKKLIGKLYDNIIDVIKDQLLEKGAIRLYGLGTLHIIDCAPKKYHNPKDGQIVVFPAQKRIRFRPNKQFLLLVNSPAILQKKDFKVTTEA